MSDDQRELLGANQAFYEAFRSRDLARLEELWARDQEVAVIHPGWPAIHGRKEVLASWKRILEGPSPPEIVCGDARAYALGSAGFVICVEHLDGGDLIATNVFAREQASWKMVHHQAGPTPQIEPEVPQGPVH